MPYSIDRYNGTQLTVVEDGTIDSTLDIKLIGKNYAGYGETQNENFVHLLENFSNPTAPPRPVAGQLWFDTSIKTLKSYTGNKWKSITGLEVSSTQPLGLTTGDLWYKKAGVSDKGQLFVYNGVDFTLVGPESAEGFGITQFRARVVQSDSGANYPILECVINDETVYIVSKAEFTIAVGQILSGGFTRIKEGLTLAFTQQTNTASATYGVTDINSLDNEPKFSFWGTASNSLKLNGKKDTDFISAVNANFNNLVKFSDAGFHVGADEDLAVYIDGGTVPTVKNRVSDLIRFQTTFNGSKFPMELSGSDILPGYDPSGAPTTGVNNIGSSSRKFNIVDANSFTGNAAGANTLLVGTAYRSSAVTATADTIVARDANGDIYSTVFRGKATEANTLLVGTAYRSSAVTATADTIVARDASGNFSANVITANLTGNVIGTSVQCTTLTTGASGTAGTITGDWSLGAGSKLRATYADLAEKYLADAEYDVGTVLKVGGEKEVTASTWGSRAIGVVSANPAFIMNTELENGTVVALKGRVPVKVIGFVKKGDRLIASNNGCAVMAGSHSSDVFAISLETNDDNGVKLVECIVL